jgi:uroporphyrinogen decarboxylase
VYNIERVSRAVSFNSPDRVPLLYFNKDQDQSDLIAVDVVDHYGGLDRDQSEWGFTWDRMDDTMGQPTAPILSSLDDVSSLHIPDPHAAFRRRALPAMKSIYGEDRYYIASLVLSGFTVISALRGFSDTLVDMFEDPIRFASFADIVFSFEEQLIIGLRDQGYQAVAFFDDWGMQDGLLISPDLWRRIFKPRYNKQFDLVHECGMDVYFHNCGYYYEIIQDFIDIGVDLLNISQPNLYNIEKLGADFGGKVCFVCPVSYQTTSISGTRNDIYQDVELLVKHLGCFNGGLIGYIEEYGSMGMSEANYQACIDAFTDLGMYP